jgi:hypothetical protein
MYYVYALIDPRNNQPFYIGKGKENRVAMHEKFKSQCNNLKKDRLIKKILQTYESIPYEILKDGFQNENDAYQYEEEIIANIGIKNLTNICESRRPPTQKNVKRSIETKEKIKINSKKQGLDRTIEYVKNNKDKIYNILIEIGRRNKRSTIVLQYNITTDLYNKIKRKYSLYVALINIHTEYKIHPVNIKKIAGMRIKAYNDYKSTLIKMYKLIDKNIKRKDVVSQLGITFSFYDRFKNQKLLFLDFINSNDIEIKE